MSGRFPQFSIKRFSALALALSFVTTSLHANAGGLLNQIPTLNVVANQPFSYRFETAAGDVQSLRVRLLNQPSGAVVTTADNGAPVFQWTPPANTSNETTIIVQAFDVNSPQQISTQRMVLKLGMAESVVKAEPHTPAITPAIASAEPATQNKTVQIQEIPVVKTPTVIAPSAIAASVVTRKSEATEAESTEVEKSAYTKRTLTPRTITVPPIGSTNEPTSEPTNEAVKKPEPRRYVILAPSASGGITLGSKDSGKVSTGNNRRDKNPLARSIPESLPVNKPPDTATIVKNKLIEKAKAAALAREDLAREDLARKDLARKDLEQEKLASSEHAPELPPLKTQLLTVGSAFQLFIRPTDADGEKVKLMAKSLPDGASLTEVFDGSWSLDWLPGVSQSGPHNVVLSVVEESDLARSAQRILKLEVQDPNAETRAETRVVLASAQGEAITPIGPTEPRPATKNSSVYFEPISAHIVSAGTTITFPVVSRSKDSSDTIVHIDRLPGRASFDVTGVGSRNFHWPTTEADQGEHVFRFTAINAQDANQVVTRDVLIVVGDPAAPGSDPN